MIHRLGQTACKASVSGHGGGQAIEAALDHAGGLAGRIAEDMRDLMQPAVDTLDRRPEGGGVRQTAADQLAQPRERRCAAPLYPAIAAREALGEPTGGREPAAPWGQ
jgi:hypothetical protein